MTPDELRSRRIELGLSQERLGRALGISGNTVARWERGVQRVANPTLVRLALDQLASRSAAQALVGTTDSITLIATTDRTTLVATTDSTTLPTRQAGYLPAPTASFVGRRGAVRTLRRLCATQRMVTLTGTAGVGKTRLALEVATQLAFRNRGGTWLIELAPLTEPAQVAQAIAGRLRIPEPPGQSVLDALIDVIAGQEVQLVLDNCEHLVDACAALTERLLQGCPRLRILVTSRQALGVEGEHVFSVPPLALPADNATVDELRRSEAVALFVERARKVQPAFALTPANAASVAEVCRHLDGLPLALELAAARMHILAPAELLERLRDRFGLLRAGNRRDPAHHQALQTTLDWSCALLSKSERQFFQRLAIFAGGFTLEAAEVSCAGDGIAIVEVLTLLSRLVERSLVVAEPATDAGCRYRLLETLRAYAADRLRTSGEAGAVAARHCDWCIGLLERFDQEWRGPAQARWFQWIELEHANVLTALHWSVENGELERGLRLAGATWRFWEVRGYLSMGRIALARLLETPGPATRARARALDAAGHLAILQDDQASGLPLVQESLALAGELGDHRALANAYHSLGLAAQYRHDYAVAAVMHTASLESARAIGDTPRTYVAIYNLAVVAQRQNDFDRATGLHEESLLLKREVGDTWSIGYSLFNLGLLAWIRGETTRATALVQESLTIRRDLGDKPGIAACLEMLAELALSPGRAEHALGPGRAEHAARLFGAADALLQTIGVRILAPRPSGLPRGVETVRARLGEASFTSAYAAGTKLPLERAIADALSTESPRATKKTLPRASGSDLTDRQREVAALVAEGLTNRQIAARLTIAEGTAQRHLANIMARLGYASRAEIAAWSVLRPSL